MSAAAKTKNTRRRPVTAAQREQRDRERREQLEDLHGQLRDHVEALTGSEEWAGCSPRLRSFITTRGGTSF